MGGHKVDTRIYQPINSYGVIGDCRSVVLVAPDGSVDWGCLPDFDSPAIFCRLLDAERGGYFQIAPTEGNIPGSQRYLRGSNVLQTKFSSIAGEVVLTDFMPVETLSAWLDQDIHSNTRMGEDDSFHGLVRAVECTRGEMQVTLALKITPDYAASPSAVSLVQRNKGAVISGGQQHIGLSIIGAYRVSAFSLSVSHEADEMHPTLIAQMTLREGERLLVALGMENSAAAARQLVERTLPQRNFDAELAHTLYCWRSWLNQSTYNGPYIEEVQRSALTLKMLTYAPTGAVVAAPTTSLPEHLGGIRNWDYRYTWLRDATFTLYALGVLGFTEEARAFINWLHRLSPSKGEDLQIMYGIRGERELAEQELPGLSGYEQSSPVLTGNHAVNQKQLDVFGEVLDLIHFYRRRDGFARFDEKLGVDGPLWTMMHSLVEHVCAHWQEADRGIWEVRGESRHFVYSKAMCWVALDRGIKAAEQLDLEADLPRWRLVREQIRADILSHGYNTTIGAFTQAYDERVLDASILMLPLVGFIPADDPRMRSTVDRIIEQLTDEQGFVYRYRSDDGLAGSEGIFTMCTFWLVDNLAMMGRVDESRSLFERLLTYAGRLGLFSEEIDSGTNRALGNYPQAFTHVALVNSALNLQRAEMRLVQREYQTEPVMAAIQLQNLTTRKLLA
ncbi:MAG TPA: glycoside hydrolase family 15 protein [Ktedonobacteraceae bacterium]